MKATLPIAALVLLLAAACGGSASETPFPQSAADTTTDPVVRRPKPRPSAGAPLPTKPKGPSVGF